MLPKSLQAPGLNEAGFRSMSFDQHMGKGFERCTAFGIQQADIHLQHGNVLPWVEHTAITVIGGRAGKKTDMHCSFVSSLTLAYLGNGSVSIGGLIAKEGHCQDGLAMIYCLHE